MSAADGVVPGLDFSKLDSVSGCVPVVVQHADTREVLLLAYTDEAALRETLDSRRLVLYSTSRRKRWEKGAESGCRFSLVEAFVNCENNSLLYLVRQNPAESTHGMCHEKTSSGAYHATCFHRRVVRDGASYSLEPRDGG